jgi:TetR/AcrR family transcriptional repressor of nem operon
MRYSEGHKEETRTKVVRAASQALRERGPDGISVAEIMKEAGLTHGGFYAHFASKDALVVAAVEAAFEDSRKRFNRAGEGLTSAGHLSEFVDYYVSTTHRDGLGRGCPVTTLSTDLPRQGGAARAAYDAGVKRLILRIASHLTVGAPEDREALAGSLLAEMAGAVMLARAVSDPILSDRLLADSRRSVKARMGLPNSSAEQA